MENLFQGAFSGITVLVTGHTGFKGSWLCTWLTELGAKVVGFSLHEPPTNPSKFEVAGLAEHLVDVRGDIRDYAQVYEVISKYQPRLIFHMAAQPIVLRSVDLPKLTMDTNAGGTINVLEAIRLTDCVKGLVSITTDKVYADREWVWGYRENEQLGGKDPYSASKAMAELAIYSYRESFFPISNYEEHQVAIASVRAGNVIGGGDFAAYRLVPDCMKALMAGEPIQVRNPRSVRPWQLVLEPLSGYLWLAAQLMSGKVEYASAWNYGPLERKGIAAEALAEKLIEYWGEGSWINIDSNVAKVETGTLRLSWEKAAQELGWRPVYNWEEALGVIVDWFKAFQRKENLYELGRQQIADYVDRAAELDLPWTKKS